MVALRRIGPIDPGGIRRAAARGWPKNSHGGRRMADYVVAAMRADYERTGSLRKVAELYGRHQTTIIRIFRRHGVAVKGRGGPNHGPKLRLA